MRHLRLSQSTRVTDRRTDRTTTPETALAYAGAVKIQQVYYALHLLRSLYSHMQTHFFVHDNLCTLSSLLMTVLPKRSGVAADFQSSKAGLVFEGINPVVPG